MNTLVTEDNEKTQIRAKLEDVIAQAKGVCQRLEEKTFAAAKTADKAVRTHPYPALGIAFGVGLLVGVLAMRSRRD